MRFPAPCSISVHGGVCGAYRLWIGRRGPCFAEILICVGARARTLVRRATHPSGPSFVCPHGSKTGSISEDRLRVVGFPCRCATLLGSASHSGISWHCLRSLGAPGRPLRRLNNWTAGSRIAPQIVRGVPCCPLAFGTWGFAFATPRGLLPCASSFAETKVSAAANRFSNCGFVVFAALPYSQARFGPNAFSSPACRPPRGFGSAPTARVR